MKQMFKKIGAFFMAFMVLFSTMSFTVSEHYCGDQLIARSLFSKAEPCGDAMDKPTTKTACNQNDVSCCIDEVIPLDAQENSNNFIMNLKFEQQVFIASFVQSYVNLFEGLDRNIVPFKHYTSPSFDEDFTVLYQSFLL